MSAVVADSAYTKDHPFPAKILENRLLNKPGSAKETRHFIVSLAGSGLHYKAGDSLGVYPTNHPAAVNEILRRLGATGDEAVTLPRTPMSISLREALTSKLTLAGPTPKILTTFLAKSTDHAERAKLTA